MKKLTLLLIIIVLFTGCSIIRVDNKETSELINILLQEDTNLYNQSFEGYKYYLPKGMKMAEKHDYNQILEANNSSYYLYIDVISYYYKAELDYYTDSSKYLSMYLNKGNKTGYIEINESKDKYFIKSVYNYAKIEVYVDKQNLNETVVNVITILKSIKYNDKVINSFVGENKLNYTEEKFSLFENDDKNDDNFLEYIEEYDKYDDTEGELPEDSKIDIEN